MVANKKSFLGEQSNTQYIKVDSEISKRIKSTECIIRTIQRMTYNFHPTEFQLGDC